MNAKSKKTVKAAAVAVGLVAVLLLPTGCYPVVANGGVGGGQPAGQQAPGSADTVVKPVNSSV